MAGETIAKGKNECEEQLGQSEQSKWGLNGGTEFEEFRALLMPSRNPTCTFRQADCKNRTEFYLQRARVAGLVHRANKVAEEARLARGGEWHRARQDERSDGGGKEAERRGAHVEECSCACASEREIEKATSPFSRLR